MASDLMDGVPLEDDVYYFLKERGREIGVLSNQGDILAQHVVACYKTYLAIPIPTWRAELERAVRELRDKLSR